MEQPKIDYTTIGRFFMSLGVFSVFISITILLSILWLVKERNLDFFFNIAYFFILFFGISGIISIIFGIYRFILDNAKDRKYKFEINFKNILDQDLKLLELKTKELEYNRKVKEFNEDFKTNIETISGRKIDSIVRQAMDSYFYERTYPEYFPKQYKGKKLP